LFLLISVADNLQNIIQEQIRSLSSGQPHHATTANRDYKENSGAAPKSAKPQMPHQQQQHAGPPATMVAAAPTLNANAQAALMILLTAQMQSQTGETSILQNPQVMILLNSSRKVF
jgi:hypothetical protein